MLDHLYAHALPRTPDLHLPAYGAVRLRYVRLQVTPHTFTVLIRMDYHRFITPSHLRVTSSFTGRYPGPGIHDLPAFASALHRLPAAHCSPHHTPRTDTFAPRSTLRTHFCGYTPTSPLPLPPAPHVTRIFCRMRSPRSACTHAVVQRSHASLHTLLQVTPPFLPHLRVPPTYHHRPHTLTPTHCATYHLPHCVYSHTPRSPALPRYVYLRFV